MLILFVLFLQLARADDSFAPVFDCRMDLERNLYKFDANFDEHITTVTWFGYLRAQIVAGGHTLKALADFAELRPDLFPHGLDAFGTTARNGVTVFRLPRVAFTTAGWDHQPEDMRSEEYGIKTTFPPSWSIQQIRDAALIVAHKKNKQKMVGPNGAFLEGYYKQVLIRVQMQGNVIMGAYPKGP